MNINKKLKIIIEKSKKNSQTIINKALKLIPPLSNMSTDIEQFRISLPTYRLRKEILRKISSYKVTLITGGTGCGKTTQVIL